MTTARKTHRELAHRTNAFTQPLANDFLSAARSQAPSPTATAAASQSETQQSQPPAYRGPPKGIQRMMAQHEPPTNQCTDVYVAPTQRTDEGDDGDTATAADEDGGEPLSTRRRLSSTPDSNLSLRHCNMYGTMMGTTSVTIDDINDTAQNMIGNFTPINTGDPMAYMTAMSALVAIEHFAMTHNVLIRECKQVADMPRTQRAIAAGLLMNRIALEQMDEDDGGTTAHATAIGGGSDTHANLDTRTTIRGGAPRMRRQHNGRRHERNTHDRWGERPTRSTAPTTTTDTTAPCQ